MRIVIQRVRQASVTIDGHVKSSIGQGLMVLVGICEEDTENDADWLAKKTIGLRIFDDEQGVMNRSVTDVGGEVMVVSQFTLPTRRATVPVGCGQLVMRYLFPCMSISVTNCPNCLVKKS